MPSKAVSGPKAVLPAMGMVAVVLLFSIAFYRTAWVTEDAFITFRVVDNALSGLGLVWNPGERVQVYTHPLWMMLLLAGRAATRAPLFWIALALSYFLFLLTLGLAIGVIRGRGWKAWVPLAALLLSKAFIDYGSSGLENPLWYALVCAAVWVWLRMAGRSQTLCLSLITSALFLTRPDAWLLVAPALAVNTIRSRNWAMALAGAIPAILWVAFSLFYYGSPVPNTALAKVGTGLTVAQNAVQAWHYLTWSIDQDKMTVVLIVLGSLAGMARRETRPFAAGLIIWSAYLVYVGADYMGGRFFSAPALLGALLLSLAASPPVLIAVAIAAVFSISAVFSTIASPRTYSNQTIPSSGIADERGYYYPFNGMRPALARGTWLGHPFLLEGLAASARPGWYVRLTIGMAGYMGGPGVKWLDALALAEPFLARLPSMSHPRVGHYIRAIPPGLIESLLLGTNAIQDPALHALYADVDMAVRQPLTQPGRWMAIVRLNTGAHTTTAAVYDRDAIGLPGHCHDQFYQGAWKLYLGCEDRQAGIPRPDD